MAAHGLSHCGKTMMPALAMTVVVREDAAQGDCKAVMPRSS